ncbi:MAG: pyruvate kinase [Caldisericia bacterium]|nr:pyruvate kinase [Caldisericia bacterium]
MERGDLDIDIMNFKKTKIIATLGPSSQDEKIIKQLYLNGVDIFRLNLSHGDHIYHREFINKVRKIDKFIPILLDLQGPKLRIGKFKNKRIFLKNGKTFYLTTENILGDDNQVSISYKNLPKYLTKGDLILLDDGRIKLKVISISDNYIETKVMLGGELSDNKGINIPKENLDIPSLTEKDKEDIKFGIKESVDYIALSFVKNENDIIYLKNFLSKNGYSIPVIAKIEKKDAIKNIDKIIDVSDGVMVARGDLGIEVNLEEIAILQKKILNKTLFSEKFSITATQILDSMVERMYPTRAEVSDITNAIFDGTDALMLSQETAVGKYPVQAVKFLNKVSQKVEKWLPYENWLISMEFYIKDNPLLSICYSAVLLALKVRAKAIIVTTETGKTAINISRFRPNVPVVALTPNEKVLKQLKVYWGIVPILVNKFRNESDIIETIESEAKKLDILKKGDFYVSVSGIIPGVPGGTNMIKLNKV